MKKLSTLFALVTVTLALTGCKSGTTETTTKAPPASKAPAKTAEHNGAHDGLACSKCVCSHFEPELAAASTCRMCGHNRANHTRPETSPVTR